MKKTKSMFLSLLLTLALVMCCSANALAAVSDAQVKATADDVARYVYQTVKEPVVGSVGGEWAVLGLARSGYTVPDKYFEDYYAGLEDYVKECKGVLHARKYTDYSRVIVALSSIGVDARNVAGYDLTKPLGDYEKTIWQGINGPIWALIALDSRNYPMPTNSEAAVQATRQMYIDRILEFQLADGGWNLAKGEGIKADADMTGMALQALAKYKDQAAVATAIDKALACLSAMQSDDGSFGSYGAQTSESCAQVITALAELGISQDDPRFVKNGNSVLDALLDFYTKGKGFKHLMDADINQMATEQGLYAVVAVKRSIDKQTTLYDMTDAVSRVNTKQQTTAEPNANGVTKLNVTKPGTTFADITGHSNKAAIEALAAREVINGMENGLFVPDNGMTRAEFATIVVRGLGLTPKANNAFKDVAANAWYAGFIGTASDKGIINGVGDGKFDPNAGITRQEATTMVARAAKLCGIDTELDETAARDEISQFGDYMQAEKWAWQGLAVCCKNGILDTSVMNLEPKAAAKRCDIAQMVYNLLDKAELL